MFNSHSITLHPIYVLGEDSVDSFFFFFGGAFGLATAGRVSFTN
jgi:hypothetical protein